MKNILILFFLSLLCASAYSKDEESSVQGAYWSFGGCDNLCYVDISRSSAKIEAYAFSGCPYLYTVNLSPGNNEIDSNAFERCPCAAWVKKFIEANK